MAKRFTIPFKSLAEKDCRIDIYDRTYTGDVVELSTHNQTAPGYPAAQPIILQEDNDESLLTVLHATTGYITLIERTFGALDCLYPEDNEQLTVEVTYDGTLVFFGYIQAQAFENEYKAVPRTLQIPVMSPLAMMDGWEFSDDPSFADGMIGEYLDECLGNYEYVIMPESLLNSADEGVNTPLQLKVNNRTVCPLNTDYDYGMRHDGETPSPYVPITYMDFIEGFCNLYGLIAHEFGKTIIFSKFDYDGQYMMMQVGDLQEDDYTTTGLPTGADVLAFNTVFSPSGSNSREGLVLPLEKLTYDYGDYTDSVPMDLSRSKYKGRVALPDYELNCAILEPQTNEIFSNYLTTAGGVLPNTDHVRVLGDGTSEMVEVRLVVPAGSSNDVSIFGFNFSNVPVNISGAKFDTSFKYNADSNETPTTLRMQVKSAGKYYDENHDWVSTPTYLPLTFDENGQCTTYDVASLDRNVQIVIFPPEGSGAAVAGVFYGITLETFADPLRKYEIPTDTKVTIKNDTPSYTSATIDMLMHTACGNERHLTGGWVQRCPYSYLFKSQLRHIRQVKIKNTIDMKNAYLMRTICAGYTGRWRIIAMSFDAWNDEYSLTLHRSTTI